MTVRDVDRGWNAIKRELTRANGREVAVGILEGSQNEGESIAEYAAHNEFGSADGAHPPSRPFMAITFDESRSVLDKDFDRETSRMVTGRTTADKALTTIGQKHAGRVQNTITGRDILPRLADSTVQAKKGSTKTLVDSGAMANAVQIELRNR